MFGCDNVSALSQTDIALTSWSIINYPLPLLSKIFILKQCATLQKNKNNQNSEIRPYR